MPPTATTISTSKPSRTTGFTPASLCPMAGPFESDRTWTFEVPAGELWSRIADVDAYRRWWPWLRSFDAGAGLVTGETWTCGVQPPLPYHVRFTIALDEVEPDRRARATVDGDITGWAHLDLTENGAGCEARLVSSLAPANPLLRRVARVAHPLVRWGHDWVLDTGRKQFVRRAL